MLNRVGGGGGGGANSIKLNTVLVAKKQEEPSWSYREITLWYGIQVWLLQIMLFFLKKSERETLKKH